MKKIIFLKFWKSLKKVLKGISHEIIFVDDNSPDGTKQRVKDCMKKSSKIRLIHRIGRKGLAGAVIEGVFAANADLVAVMDCDLQHDETKAFRYDQICFLKYFARYCYCQ